MMPYLLTLAFALGLALAAPPPTAGLDNLAETLEQHETFSVFTELLREAGLLDLIDGEADDGFLTVFAPPDEVFARLSPTELEALRADGEALRDLLSYHIGLGRFTSSDILEVLEVSTFHGEPVFINYIQDVMTVNDVLAVQIDILASNGVIHVINELLLPPAPNGQRVAQMP